MARQERHDVDYFPFYAKDGKTLFILESKYQCRGTGFFTNTLRFLSVTPDHHFCIAEETDRMMFFAKTFCDEESGTDMLNIMAKTGKIDKELWEEKQVIASEAHLESIKDAYRKRNNEIITMDEIRSLYGITSAPNPHNSAGNPAEHPHNGITSGSNPQSKRKESKEKEIIKSSSIELPLKEDVKEFSKPLIREWTDSIAEHLYQEGYKGAPQFKNTGLKMKKDERTVLWALIQCCKYRPPPDKMWPYCTKIIRTEDGNFNEYEYGKSI